MLRLNVAPDRFRKDGWIVHLFADYGAEHIYQFSAPGASDAARLALDLYEQATRANMKITGIVATKAPDYRLSAFLGAAPEYPETTHYVFSVED